MTDAGQVPRLLEGRAVVVTGTSRGIGAAIATRAAAAGARVLGVSRAGTAGDVPGLVPLAVDVRADDAPDRILAAALEAFGRVDGLVNNAGIIHHANCWEHGDAEWDDLFETNLTAPFRLTQRFAAHWLDAGAPGVVVNVGSVESEVAMDRQAGYAATKGGLLGLTRALALELSPQGVRVVAIAPGVIETDMPTAVDEQLVARIPAGRRGTPAEVGDVTTFLLSDLAAYMTGTMVFADGGYVTR